MKKRLSIGVTLAITVLLLGTALPRLAAAMQDSSSTITLTYPFATPQISTVDIEQTRYDTVSIAGAPNIGRAGDPSLPAAPAYILLPPKTTVATVTIHGTATSLGTGYHIVPVSDTLPLTADPRPPTPNPNVYSQDTAIPVHQYQLEGVYQQRGFTILVLSLYPVQYRPVSGELSFCPSLEVTVSLAPAAASPLYRGLPQDFNLIRTRVDNPSMLSAYQPKTAARSTADVLILTTTALQPGFAPLAAEHNATGKKTIIRTLTDVGGSDTEMIRTYIRTQYTTLGISYVLLGGDDGVVPDRQLWVEGMDEGTTHYEDFMPSDIYYGCLDGPYNYDGDNKWGEPNDGTNGGDVDLMAEVYVGRACVDNSANVAAFVAKTVSYLNTTNDSYLRKTLLAGEYLGDYGIASYGSSYMEQLMNGSTADNYTTVGIPASVYQVQRLYDEVGWSAYDMMQAIDNGVHFINHLGHANEQYNMKMDMSDVDALTNTKYCFIYSQGCYSGAFDDMECMAEEFTAKTIHGAFAGVWNARYGFFWSFSTDGDSQRLHRQFWDAVFGENKTTVGAANHDCKEDNLYIITRSCIRWCIYQTNLFGDPAADLISNVAPPPPPPPPVWPPHTSIVNVTGGKAVLHFTIANVGNVTAENVTWHVQITGGIFHRISLAGNGGPFNLSVNETKTEDRSLGLFGLGSVTVQVNVSYAAQWNGTGFALGPYLLKVAKV